MQIHARLGELQYMAATTGSTAGEASQKYLVDALKRFCRSIELCDDYLRGHYGLKLVRYSAITRSTSWYTVAKERRDVDRLPPACSRKHRANQVGRRMRTTSPSRRRPSLNGSARKLRRSCGKSFVVARHRRSTGAGTTLLRLRQLASSWRGKRPVLLRGDQAGSSDTGVC